MQHFEPKLPSSHAKSYRKKKCCGIKAHYIFDKKRPQKADITYFFCIFVYILFIFKGYSSLYAQYTYLYKSKTNATIV